MTAENRLGIWMDHSNAHLMEFSMSSMETRTLNSTFTHQVKEDSLEKSEKLMHNKEQHRQATYYKQLGDIIRNYTDVILFGPTDAKTELLNILKADHRFEKIKIDVRQADKMSEGQQQAFVRDYFSKK